MASYQTGKPWIVQNPTPGMPKPGMKLFSICFVCFPQCVHQFSSQLSILCHLESPEDWPVNTLDVRMDVERWVMAK